MWAVHTKVKRTVKSLLYRYWLGRMKNSPLARLIQELNRITGFIVHSISQPATSSHHLFSECSLLWSSPPQPMPTPARPPDFHGKYSTPTHTIMISRFPWETFYPHPHHHDLQISMGNTLPTPTPSWSPDFHQKYSTPTHQQDLEISMWNILPPLTINISRFPWETFYPYPHHHNLQISMWNILPPPTIKISRFSPETFYPHPHHLISRFPWEILYPQTPSGSPDFHGKYSA